MKKIAVITGTRAEYGLLKPLIKAINNDPLLDLQLIATAMHLSPEYGFTIQEILDDGLVVKKKVECLLSSDTAVGVTKSVGIALLSFAEVFEELQPNIVLILGDRTEMLAAATAAMIANIPIAHIHGGETTEGAYDEYIRHAITKMSYWHFSSTETYRKRIIQLGEEPNRVFNVGAIGLDSIRELNLLSKKDLEKSLDFQLGEKTVLVTYHPVTLDENSSGLQFQNILDALDTFPEIKIIFTHANSDRNGKIINKMIGRYVKENPTRAVEFQSLGQLRYFSALQFVDCVLGNSSSGILEVPYFGIPTINIGDRQKGRIAPTSVIQTSPVKIDIESSISKAFSKSFASEIINQEHLYGVGTATEEIVRVLREEQQVNLKKPFYDINFKA